MVMREQVETFKDFSFDVEKGVLDFNKAHFPSELISEPVYSPIWETTIKAIEQWLRSRRKNSTRSTYQVAITQFFRFVGKPLAEISPEDIEIWVAHLMVNLKASTVSNKLSAVKSFLTFCARRSFTPDNIGAKVESTRIPKDTLAERILESDDCWKIIDAAEGQPRDRAILYFLFQTGVRVSELCDLTWRDLHLKNDGSCLVTIYGKGDRTRTVIISNDLYNNLKDLPKYNEFVFNSNQRKRIARNTVHYLVKKYAEKANIHKNVSCHVFRHSHATAALESGADLHLVSQSLGHAGLDTTSRYLHIRPNQCSSQFIKRH